MQVQLFKALQSIKVHDDTATQVVETLESHIAMKVTDANKALEKQLDALSGKLDFQTKIQGFIALTLTALTTFGIAATAWIQLMR